MKIFKTIQEERLDRLITRKHFNDHHNQELVDFLLTHVDKENNVKQTIDYMFNININHPGLKANEYLVHPLRIAKIVYLLDNNSPSDLITTALLHNILEVTSIDPKNILDEFNENVLDAISTLTVNRLKQKSRIYKEHYYKRINSNSIASMIKAVDKFDNLFLLCLNNDEKTRKWYLDEVTEHVLPLTRRISTDFYAYYCDLLEDCYSLGFLDRKKSILLYNDDYS